MGLCFPCPAESAPPSPSPVSSMSRPDPARGGRCHAAGLKVNLPGCWTCRAAGRSPSLSCGPVLDRTGRISGDFGYPISGGKEEEERTVGKADGNIRATSRWTQVDGVMKHHTLEECCAANSSICSQMDLS
ncbi:hypothetical protein U0070_014282 [Myodes glareolus]|uniref:Uncharacterized protein n=1 Tax=Myodes glareolus TaxID=447135 RepID=A0AAW0I2D6_MYOGA